MSNAWLDARTGEEEWPIRLVIGKDLPPDDENLPIRTGRLVVTAGIRQPPDGYDPHFSITAELVDRTKHRSEWGVTVGPQPERIIQYFPELEPVVSLHSTDLTAVPPQQANEAVDRLLELGAKDNRVATAARQALDGTETSTKQSTATPADDDARTVIAEPYTARQCPECETWVYVDDGPFAENDRTKTVADFLHWERLHLQDPGRAAALQDPDRGAIVTAFPFFRYNETPVEATIEATSTEETPDHPSANPGKQMLDRLSRMEQDDPATGPEPPSI